jgi:hypothetical protein
LIEQAVGEAQRHVDWQELVDRHGFTGSYQSVKRFVRELGGGTATGLCAD